MGLHLCLPARLIMKAALLLLSVVGTMAAPAPRFTCSECVDEMHKLGHLVKEGAKDINAYLTDNYCPTLEDEDQATCADYLGRYYIEGLYAIANHFFLWMELFTFARLWGCVMQGDTLVKSAWRDSSGWKGTWRTP